MDGMVHFYESKHWYKIEAKIVEPSIERPHGIKYSLTFHDRHNKRIFGIDNAHLPQSQGRYKARLVTYDHLHRNEKDKGIPYNFTSTYKLIEDFFELYT